MLHINRAWEKLEGLVILKVSGNLCLVFEYMEHDLAGLIALPTIKFSEPQVMTTGQRVTIEYHGNGYIFTVNQAGVEGQVKSNSMDRGMILPDTYIVFQASNSSGMKIVNQCEAASSNIFKHKEFNLESLGIGGLSVEFADIFRRAFASRVFPPHVTSNDIVEMASYAPLFVNTKDRRWNPDAIVFNSFQQYGTPSYWMQHFFIESSGATLLNSTLKANSSSSLVASAIAWSEDDKNYLRIKSRGSTRDGTGVYDSIVNQLLTKIDGVESLNNVLLIEMTNRKDLLDDALLRPARLEVQVEMSLLDEHGRLQILQIHTNKMKENCTRLLGSMSIFGRIKYFWMDVYG